MKLAKNKARLLQKEQQDAKKLEEALPKVIELVTKAENSIDAVVAAASPLSTELTEDMNESVEAAINETEAAAATTKLLIQTARQEVSGKITASKQFAPETQKVALGEYSGLNEKLNEAQKKLNPYIRIRKEYEQKLEAKGIMTEVAHKLGHVEVEVEKLMSLLGGGASVSEADVKEAEESLTLVESSLQGAIKFVKQRIQSAKGSLKEELSQMQERGAESKRKLDKFRELLRTKTEEVQQQLVLRRSLDKTLKAEKSLEQIKLAETPFLKGIDLSVGSAAGDAIAQCEDVVRASEKTAKSAKSFLKAQLVEIKCFPEERQPAIIGELGQMQDRVDVVVRKLQIFQRDTAQRKSSLLLQDVTQKVADAEAKVQKVAQAAEPLGSDKVEETATDKVRAATEKTLQLEKAAALACADARKELLAKQKHEQSKESPTYVVELSKLQARLNAAARELLKDHKSALSGEKLWKSKVLEMEKGEEMKRLEGEIEKVEILTTPLGDERLSDEAIAEIDVAVNASQDSLSGMANSIESSLATAQGGLKHFLSRLLVRTKRAQETLDEVKSRTQGQRERVKCDKLVEMARIKIQKVDEAFEKVAQAEVPYLKGVDIIVVEEATQALADSEAAIVSAQQAISEARTFLTSKSLEIRSFVEVVSRIGLGQIGELSKKNEEATEKLVQFKKETEGRKRIAQQLEAVTKVNAAAEAVQKAILAAAPLAAEDVDEISKDVAKEMCEKLAETEKVAQAKLGDARKFLAESQRIGRSQGEQAELSKLKQRLNEVQIDLAKARATANVHEQKILARMLLEEATDLVQVLENEIEKATDAAAPLIVDGGKGCDISSMRGLDRTIIDVECAAAKANTYSNEKAAELRDCKAGALADARSDLAKLRPRVSVAQTKFDTLKKRVEEGKLA